MNINDLSTEELKKLIALAASALEDKEKEDDHDDGPIQITDNKDLSKLSKNKRKKLRRQQSEFDLDEHRQSRRRPPNKRAGTKLCRVEGFNKTKKRKNRLYEMKDSHGQKIIDAHKQDAEIDKKLSGNKKPTPRRDKVEFIYIQCSGRCRKYFNVSPALVRDDGIFICNDCSLPT